MFEVLAGDWKTGPAGIATKMNGSLKQLVLPKGWLRYDRIKPHQIESVEIITQENQTSVIGKVAWGAAGSVALGGLGLLAGVVGGGNKNKATAIVTLVDGRSALVSGDSRSIQLLAAAALQNKRDDRFGGWHYSLVSGIEVSSLN